MGGDRACPAWRRTRPDSFEDPFGFNVGPLNNALGEPAVIFQGVSKLRGGKEGEEPYSLISFSAFSTESEPWQTLRPTARAKSPRMVPIIEPNQFGLGICGIEGLGRVPGALAKGLVAPRMARPVFTASRPSQTIATTGPLAMYLMRPGKNGLSLRSA